MNPNDPLNQLFAAYVKTVGPNLAKTEMERAEKSNASFLYLNGFNFVYWPANTTVPVQYQALANGVIQLAGVSHLGPALASLVEVYQENLRSGSDQWQEDLSALLSAVIVSQDANSPDYWEAIDPIVLISYSDKMSEMIGDGLDLVGKYLEDALKMPKLLNYDDLIDRVLNPQNKKYTFNKVMIGTFSLANLLVQYHSIHWLQNTIPADGWGNCSVLFGGQFGRATGGLSVDTNTAVRRLIVASNKTLDKSQILIAPASPNVDPTNVEPAYWAGIKTAVQNTWWLTHSSSHLSPKMFPEYESVLPQTPQTLPPQDIPEPPFNEFMERLKFALGNTDQELASCTAAFMVDTLANNNFNPSGLFIPGMHHDSN